jgi:hypothetical protein
MTEETRFSLSEAEQARSQPWGRQEILSFLDKEIETFLADRSRPGWSVWAILAALCSVLWLLLQQIESSALSVNGVPLAVLSVAMGLDALRLANMGLRRDHFQLFGSPRFRMARDWSDGNLAPQLMSLVRYVGLIFLMSACSEWLLPFEYWMGVTYAGFNSLTLVLGILICFVDFPLPADSTAKLDMAGRIIALLEAGLAMIPAFNLLVRLLPKEVSFAELRLGGLIVVGVYLLTLLADGGRTPAVVVGLREVRRGLMFGHIEPSAALRHAEIAIRGLALDDALREHVFELLKVMNEMEMRYSEILRRVSAAKGALLQTSGAISQEQRLVAESVLADCRQRYEKQTAMLEQLKALMNRWAMRRGLLGGLTGQKFVETSFDGHVEAARVRVNETIGTINNQLEELAALVSEAQQSDSAGMGRVVNE